MSQYVNFDKYDSCHIKSHLYIHNMDYFHHSKNVSHVLFVPLASDIHRCVVCSYSFIAFFFPSCHMIGNMQLVYFETGFFHLPVHFLLTLSIAGIRCGFFIVQLYFIVWVYHNLFTHPPVKCHLNSLVSSGFWSLWINPR